MKNCVNKATVLTENKTNEDFGTAAGIVSTSNQRAPGTVVTLTGCKNEGQVEGQYVAGMIGSIFRSNYKTDADADSAAATTKMIFDQCENTGKLICNVYERYYKTVNKTYCNGYVAGIVAYAYNERYSVEITNCTVSGRSSDASGIDRRQANDLYRDLLCFPHQLGERHLRCAYGRRKRL